MRCEGKSKPKQSWQEVKLVYKHVDLNSKLYVWELQNAHPHLKCEDTFYLDFWGESVGLFLMLCICVTISIEQDRQC